MEAKALDRVARSLERLKLLSNAAATLFLSRIAELDKSLLPVFADDGKPGPVAVSRVQLLARAGLAASEARAMRQFARRCVEVGVGYRDHAVITAATLWTLHRILGESFTLADREAWIGYQHRLLLLLRRAARVDQQQAA